MRSRGSQIHVEQVEYAARPLVGSEPGTVHIPGIHYRPDPSPTAAPGVVVMHGGPTTRALLLSEDYLCRGLAQRGYVVLAGHYRQETGSSASDDADSLAGLDYLCALPYVNPDRLGMAGHSRGGFATQRLAGREPRLKSIVSLGSGTGMTDVDERNKPYSYSHYVSLFSMGGGTPEGNARRRATKGPSTAELEAIKIPVLWLHGSRDLNAPPEAAIEAHDVVSTAGNANARLELIQDMDHFWGHPTGPKYGEIVRIVGDWYDTTL